MKEFLLEASRAYVNTDIATKIVNKNLSGELEEISSAGYTFRDSSFTKLDSFMISMAWLMAVKPVREAVQEGLICAGKEEYESRRLNAADFLESISDLKNYLMKFAVVTSVKELNVWRAWWRDSLDQQGDSYRLKPDGPIARLAALTMFRSAEFFEDFDSMEDFAKRFVRGAKVAMTDFAVIRGNWVLYVMSSSELEEETDKEIDLFLTSIRWLVAWLVLLLGVTSALSEIFILYNELMDAYLTEEARSYNEIASMTRSAALEFSDFYDVESISEMSFRELFEYLKETSHVNELHASLIRRLDTFSDREADAVGHGFSFAAIMLTLGIIASAIPGLLGTMNLPFPWWRPVVVRLFSAFGFGADLIIAGFLFWYFKRKAERYLEKLRRYLQCFAFKVGKLIRGPAANSKEPKTRAP